MEQRETWASSDISGAPMAGSSDIRGARLVEGGEGKEERGKRSDAEREVASEEEKGSRPVPAPEQQQQQVSGQEDQGYGVGRQTAAGGERVGVVAGAADGAADPYDVVPTDWELLTLSQMGLSQFDPSGSSGGNPARVAESLSMLDGSMLDASTLSSVLGDSSFMVTPREGRGGGGEGIFPLPSPSDVELMERASEALGGLHASKMIPPSYGISPRGIVSTTHEEGGLPGGGGQAAGSPPFITTWQRAGYGVQSAPGPISASSPLSTATGRGVLSSPRSSPPRSITADVKSSRGGGDHQDRRHGQGEGGVEAETSPGGRDGGGGGGGGGGGRGGEYGDDASLGGSLGEDAWRVAISSSGLGGGLQTSLSGSVGSRWEASQVVVGGEGSAVGEGGVSEYNRRRSSVMSTDASALTDADDSDLISTDTSAEMARQKNESGGMTHVADRGVVGTAPLLMTGLGSDATAMTVRGKASGDEGVSGGALEGEKEEAEEREIMMSRAAIQDDGERRYYDMPYIDRADQEKRHHREPAGYVEGEGEEGRGSSLQSGIGSVDDTDVPVAGSGQGGQENQEGGETEEGQAEGSTAASAAEGEGVQQGKVAADGKMTRNGNEAILSGRWWRWSWYELWHNRHLLLRQCQATLRGQSGTLWSIGVVAAILGLLLVGNQWYWERWQNQQARNHASKKDEMIDDLRSQMLRWKDGFVSRYRVPVIRTASSSFYSGSFH
ncbi:hypothetical protein CBR_g46437 [Chara braunii]|uniref:Uncharacterized protein n=1 Tax=Chara braunii TaxID=69332 RepID=A0A388M0H7_CHABU|nr:hypothetical protein CBR_g46437 [Chara braunii]|eukprot:GBG88068.1 hypothetical protein CBR_g46437 [Chara braunii]